jgi:hypothetical protein
MIGFAVSIRPTKMQFVLQNCKDVEIYFLGRKRQQKKSPIKSDRALYLSLGYVAKRQEA